MSSNVFTRAPFVLPTVVWTVVCAPPDLIRPCAGCGSLQSFRTSERFRVNGQGRRLDVWLIYRCVRCEGTYNLAVHARRRPEEIGHARLVCFERNDAAVAREVASDAQALRASRSRLAPRSGFEVEGPALTLAGSGEVEEARRVAVELRTPAVGGPRVERVFARQLGVSRRELAAAVGDGRVVLPRRCVVSASGADLVGSGEVWCAQPDLR